jgi:hypothetical protein
VVRIVGFVKPVSYELSSTDSPVFANIYHMLGSDSVRIIITILLIYVQAIMINRIALKNKLMRSPNYLPAFFYILIMSFIPQFHQFHPLLLANTFFILCIGELFKTYKNPNSAKIIFNAGLFLSISVLLYLPFLFMYLLCSLALLLIRSYNVLERIQLLIGFSSVLVLLAYWLFYTGKISNFISVYFINNLSMPSNIFSGSEQGFIVLAVLMTLVVINVLYYRGAIAKKGIQVEKKIDVLYWILILSIPTVFFWVKLDILHMLILAFPLSIMLSMLIQNIRNIAFSELLALSLLGLLFSFQFLIS